MGRRGFLRLATAVGLTTLAAAFAAPAPAVAGGEEPSFYGVVSQAGLRDDDFARMRAKGVGLMRVQLSWKKVQASEGRCESELEAPDENALPPVVPVARCDWAYYDRIIGGAAAAGVETLPYLLTVPEFVSGHENAPPIRSQRAREMWHEWVRITVARYGPGGEYWREVYPSQFPGAAPLPVTRWQVWNEPSDGTFWHPRPNPDEYAQLVELTSSAIRSIDPAAEVILAGLFATPNRANGGIRVKPFLRRLFAGRDLGAHFDSLALHPYAPNLKRSKRQIRMARPIFRRAGLRGRPLWITEIGWASGGSHSQLSKTPRRQAKLVRKTYRLFERRREKWDIAGVTWFAWQDTDDRNACPFCAQTGLVTVDRKPKPALRAYRRAARGG